MVLQIIVLIVCGLFQATLASSINYSVGTTLVLGGVHYYVPSTPIAKLPPACAFLSTSSGSGYGFVAVTVFESSGEVFGSNELSSSISSYLKKDDVFNEAFLEGCSNVLRVGLSYLPLILTVGNSSVVQNISSSQPFCLASNLVEKGLPPGPYLLSLVTGDLHIPYRLYEDVQGAFTTGVVPGANGSFESLAGGVPSSSSPSIGVPSRLYYVATPQQPLAGVRLGVKDLYNLQGLKTGAGSRAYYDLYPEANATAPAVQRLIDAGAMVVGKMKTTQFAAPEFVSLAIDYQAPFNARGDGYQEPGSSSSGPGAAVGAYSWLDIALGSDTGGSVRVPAQENGLYGNRPSYDHVSLEKVIPLGPAFDTAGFLARDPRLWREASRVLYSGLNTNYTSYPARIQTFGLTSSTETTMSPADALITEFVQKLGEFLTANTTQLNYTQRWIDTHPNGTDPVLEVYLNSTWEALTAQPQVDLVRTSFFADYAAKYDGREPYVNPSTRVAWDWALAETPSVTEATTQKSTFMQWWNSEILSVEAKTCSNSLVLYVGKNALGVSGQSSYRDTQIPGIGIVTGLLGGLFISPLSGVPDFVVPLGQVPYDSSVTNHSEFLPVTIDIMAAEGCDLMLLDLINDLNEAGILPTVQSGTSIYGGATYL